MTTKLFPFWKLIPPEVITYWQDKCESLPNGWVWNPPYNSMSLSSPAKEGSFCFKVYTTWYGVVTQFRKDIIPSIALPSTFNFRFWVKVTSVSGSELYLLGLTAGTVGISVWDVGDGVNLYVRIRNAGYESTQIYSMTKDIDHLVRLEVEQDGATVRVKLYIDKVYKGIWSRVWVFGNLSSFLFQDNKGAYELYVDWFRVTNL